MSFISINKIIPFGTGLSMLAIRVFFFSFFINEIYRPGNNCTYANARFSTDFSHYVLTCTGPDPTTVEIYNREHKKIYSWQTNEYLRHRVKNRLQPTHKIVNVRVNGYVLRARMALPPGFNESLSYPMIVQV